MCHYFCDTLLLLTQLYCVVELFGDHADTVIADCGSNFVTAAVKGDVVAFVAACAAYILLLVLLYHVVADDILLLWLLTLVLEMALMLLSHS